MEIPKCRVNVSQSSYRSAIFVVLLLTTVMVFNAFSIDDCCHSDSHDNCHSLCVEKAENGHCCSSKLEKVPFVMPKANLTLSITKYYIYVSTVSYQEDSLVQVNTLNWVSHFNPPVVFHNKNQPCRNDLSSEEPHIS